VCSHSYALYTENAVSGSEKVSVTTVRSFTVSLIPDYINPCYHGLLSTVS
jgi:hypothetical protein